MKDDKFLEELSEKYLQDLSMEETPAGLSDTIMARIQPAMDLSRFAYRPLISKKIWVGVFLIWVTLIIYFLILDNASLTMLDQNFLNIELPALKMPALPVYLEHIVPIITLMVLAEFLIVKFLSTQKISN